MPHYALLDNVKIKLRLKDADQSLSEELETYLTDADSYINRKLRGALGFTDVHGNPIQIPLTDDTIIQVDDDLIQIGTNLAVGRFRKEQNNEEKLWENATQDLEDYMLNRFGWPEDSGQRVVNPTSITATPTSANVGSTITVSGENFRQFQLLEFFFNDSGIDTIPENVFVDSLGKFSGATFVVPDNLSETKAFEIRVQDGSENVDNRADTFISIILGVFNFTVDARLV